MKKLFLLVNLVSALFVLVAVQIHGFDFESEFPQDSEASKSQYFPKSNDEETFQYFPQESEFFQSQQIPYDIDAPREIQSPPPVPSPSPSYDACFLNYKCSLDCSKTEIPSIQGLCVQLCSTECLLRRSILIYSCIYSCAESMPEIFKSDKKKSAQYVDYCIDKCNKKF
ncbi:hypothetical protein V6N13_050764 [Hibiscus sabdariffa]|uniref:Uncharacterized protein n=1 Tax=Hibiscus sabdariffa TaxID=183260 RepID=A0ABR2PI95_9ROSI